jgi:dinuclear metal center YbgI/SA1388 family protein
LSITRQDLLLHLNTLLRPSLFKDYAPNGLQIEGKNQIIRIATAVTASQCVIDEAIKAGADALLVHHGYFWNGENPTLVGSKKSRIASLMRHDINLFAYHLPLDAHEVLGNNVQLAERLGIHWRGTLADDSSKIGLVFYGDLSSPMTPTALKQLLKAQLSHDPLWIAGTSDQIKTLAWCTGAAQDYLSYAIDAGVDAFITGEVSERTYHLAKENGIHFFAAGHHATERYGIQALGRHLAETFSVSHIFIDEPNPV